MYNPSHERQSNRRQKDGTLFPVGGTEVNIDYNKKMGFVDKTDMLSALFHYDRKSKKWWHRIFCFLYVAVVNSFLIFSSLHEDKITFKMFKISFIHGLAGAAGMKSKASKRPSGESSYIVCSM